MLIAFISAEHNRQLSKKKEEKVWSHEREVICRSADTQFGLSYGKKGRDWKSSSSDPAFQPRHEKFTTVDDLLEMLLQSELTADSVARPEGSRQF